MDQTGTAIKLWMQWSHFATLTFKAPIRTEDALKCVRTQWLRTIARTVGMHLQFAYALGPQPGGKPHLHLLLALGDASAEFTPEIAAKLWLRSDVRAGRCEIARYDSGGAAAWYMANHDDCSVDIACPRFSRCKKRGCSVMGTRT